MREIRKLLERLSGTIGEEERASIKAMIAHYKTVSEDVTHTVADVKAMVAENRKPVRDAVADMRKTMEETRKAAEEARPLAVGALDSGKKMFDEGQRVAKETAGLIEEVRPQAASLIANADKAAKATAGALAELEKLVGEAELAVNENRPTLRRAMLDARESTRNLEEMTDRLKREPWLLFKKQSGSQDAAVLDSAARNLRETSENLAVAMGYLQAIAADPESAKRLGKENVEGLLEQVRAACRELQGRRDAIEKKLKEVERKSGGAPLERQREEADRAQ
jgi:ABC-type transporter Mla subunit MlaD